MFTIVIINLFKIINAIGLYICEYCSTIFVHFIAVIILLYKLKHIKNYETLPRLMLDMLDELIKHIHIIRKIIMKNFNRLFIANLQSYC